MLSIANGSYSGAGRALTAEAGDELSVRSGENILSLYLAHRGELVNYANGIVGDRSFAEDVVQEAWVRFGSATARQSIDEPVSYLYRIVRNLALDGRRRRHREGRTMAPAGDEVLRDRPDAAPSPERSIADRSELRLVADAWAELPERTRIAMEMRQLGGCKLKDIAAHLGISITAAHRIIADGITFLRCRVRPP